jgi:glycosyltransferase involved in cell wall biosynthesis
VVFGVRGSDLDDMPKDALARLAMRLQHLLARRARLTVANSDAAGRELRERGYPASRVRVVRNGIDPSDFAADPGDRARWRARLGVADDEQLVATVARMDRQKDAGTFLRAAARAARPGRRFAWFGDGPLRPQVQSLARSLGIDLLVPGALHDMRAAYPAIDVFTLTSAWGEAFSNAFAEALAAGRACVVTDTGDHASACAVATVVPPADPAALARGWERAAPGDGPGWLRANLGVDQMVSSTEALLLDAMRGT